MKKSVIEILTIGLLTCSMLLLISCTKSNAVQDSLPYYVSLNKLPENYTLKEAKADGCVVFEDFSLTSGKTKWNKFLEMTQSGHAAIIRLVYYYSKEEDSSLCFVDLSFNGSTYSVLEKDGEHKQYKFLNHYTNRVGTNINFSTLDYYILVNEKDVTYDELEKSLVSSNSNDLIDQYRIYMNQLQ